MSWRSDAFDGVFDVEQDQDLEDFEETDHESLPVQKKMKKNASKQCRQAEEKPRTWHILNKAEEKHVVTHIATIKDVFSRTGIRIYVLPRVISHVILQIYFALRAYLILSAVYPTVYLKCSTTT